MMRVLISSLICFVLLTMNASAQSVLLPEDNGDSPSPPNLGLAPTLPTPTAPQTSPFAPQPEPSPIYKTAPQTSATTPAIKETPTVEDVKQNISKYMPDFKNLEAKNNAALSTVLQSAELDGPIQITPGGRVAEDPSAEQQSILQTLNTVKKDAKGNIPTNMELIIKGLEEQTAKRKERPPVFINEYKKPVLDDSQFPNQIIIDASENYIWGENDIKMITRTFGYERKEIPLNCQLRLDATLSTSDSSIPYTGQAYTGKRTPIKYQGVFNSVTLNPRAVCHKPVNLPQSGSIIMKTGDKYSLQLLNSSLCTLDHKTTSKPTGVIVQYVGDGKSNCTFQ